MALIGNYFGSLRPISERGAELASDLPESLVPAVTVPRAARTGDVHCQRLGVAFGELGELQ